MTSQFINRIKNLSTRVLLNKFESKIVKNNKLNKRTNPLLTQKKVLIQMPEDYYYVALFSVVIDALREFFNIHLSWININCEYQRISKISRSSLYERKWTKLYQSNGGETSLNFLLYDEHLQKRYKAKTEKYLSKLSSKEDLVQFSYAGITIGDLIYDTYLRYKPAPTVDLNDAFLINVFSSALHIADTTESYLNQKKTDLLITSYCTYIHHGIPVRLGLKHKIKVLSFGNYLQIAKKVESSFPFHVKDHTKYKKEFELLPENVQRKAFGAAKEILEARLTGSIDYAISYMKKSAFSSNDEKYFAQSSRPRVVFFLHCFFDSPHIYKSMLFPDFYEWITQSLDELAYSSYDIYIKPHPNGVDGNDKIVQQIVDNYPFIKLLPASASNYGLAKEGFDVGITVYGTLIHEFNYLGIPILSAGDNPHSSFSFGESPRSMEEYKKKLGELNKLNKPTNAQKEEVLSFFYMHSLDGSKAPLNTEKDIIETLRGLKSSELLSDFLIHQNDKYQDIKNFIKPIMVELL